MTVLWSGPQYDKVPAISAVFFTGNICCDTEYSFSQVCILPQNKFWYTLRDKTREKCSLNTEFTC